MMVDRSTGRIGEDAEEFGTSKRVPFSDLEHGSMLE
jgi:hypothetical protein